ncbi:hypothetical protein Bpfe_026461, partial [Biomphalaria pfeifferi]
VIEDVEQVGSTTDNSPKLQTDSVGAIESFNLKRAMASRVFKSTDIYKHIYDRHETCVSHGASEANLQEYVVCSKNPRHKEFVPVDEFTMQDLPVSFRDDTIFRLVKLMFGFTVKIDVRMTSPLRPQYWEGSTSSYPFYDLRNRCNVRMGSGSIRSLYKYTGGHNSEGRRHWNMYASCACRKCIESDSPSATWWEIEVMTATHVVYDDTEAYHASCTMFYDGPGHAAVVLDTVVVDYANVETDKCWLRCVTCDRTLAATMEKMIQEFDQAWRSFHPNYQKSKYTDKLALTVSHPHGCTKQVSVGQWVDRIMLDGDENFSCYTYTTPTCPGTSGATVYVLGYHNGQRYMYSDHHVHSGVSKSGFNYCGNGYDL